MGSESRESLELPENIEAGKRTNRHPETKGEASPCLRVRGWLSPLMPGMLSAETWSPCLWV